MVSDDDCPAGAPEWMVTFGDLMSLLLTFFILLVSMSEIKKNDRFQGIADSIQQHFGYDSTQGSAIPGESRPRNSEIAALVVTGRTQRSALLQAGDPPLAEPTLTPRVVILRDGDRTAIGAVIHFEDSASTLSAQNRADLQAAVELFRGKPQKIEVRGHTSRNPPEAANGIRDNWDLAYERSRQTFEYLVQELKISPARIRLAVAGPYEPAQQPLAENPRVEVFLLDEVPSPRDMDATN